MLREVAIGVWGKVALLVEVVHPIFALSSVVVAPWVAVGPQGALVELGASSDEGP